MPFRFAEAAALTELQCTPLELLGSSGSTPRALVFRCPLILRAADRDHPINLRIAAEFDSDRHTARGRGHRYVSIGLAGSRTGRGGTTGTISVSERDSFWINWRAAQSNSKAVGATRWSLDDLAATLINRTAHAFGHAAARLWRNLDEADLKPHRSVELAQPPRHRLRRQGSGDLQVVHQGSDDVPTGSIGDLL